MVRVCVFMRYDDSVFKIMGGLGENYNFGMLHVVGLVDHTSRV